ncbi:MAG: type IV pilus biogenesis/stability protein PilW [Pseudomonadales bacterium]|nr:type IV pilus biogenesis/stability protein PilW [Pseudomonadales bacterium]
MMYLRTTAKKLTLVMVLALLGGCVTTEERLYSVETSDEQAVQTYVNLALSYMSNNQTEAAKRPLRLAKEIDPESPLIYGAMAYMMQKLGDAKLAEQNYKKALKLDPSFQPTRNNYGAFLYQKKRYQDAYDAFIIVAEDPLYPRRFYAYENLGFCAIKLGDFRLAETHFKKALVLNANLFRSLIELAEIQYRKQDFSAVEDYLRQYRDLATLNKIPNSAQILWLKIRTARAQNKGVEQMRNVRKLRSEFPESNEYQMYLNSLSNTSQKVAR